MLPVCDIGAEKARREDLAAPSDVALRIGAHNVARPTLRPSSGQLTGEGLSPHQHIRDREASPAVKSIHTCSLILCTGSLILCTGRHPF